MAPKEKILVAMSGGVDSSVAAAQLVEQGYDVAGAYMKIWVNEVEPLGECPQQQDIEDARGVAARLGIPFDVVNLMQEYRDHVVSYLLQGYGTGVTPNPDAMCNRFIKFGHFLQYARSRGFDAVATGHYARRVAHPDGSAEILTGLDCQKDQTYFLALLNQEQARAARFPIGALEKAEVRALAARYGLANAAKKDSQGICFIGEIKMADFLRAFMPDAPGTIVDPEGRPLGTHPGLHYFTLGQAKGLGVPSNRFGEKYVVVAKRPATRELVVAFDRPDSAGLYATACTINSVGFIHRSVDAPRALEVRPRYRCPSQAAHYEPLGEGRARLVFERPQRALTPGQVAALYDGEHLLGGGVFETIDPAP